MIGTAMARDRSWFRQWSAAFLTTLLVAQSFGGLATSALAAPQARAGQNGSTATNTLILRGLDKISGQPSNIIAPIGKQVSFATLKIIARYCYSTPPTETPQTVAFLQIDDDRPDQPPRRVFSGWMYASNPGLNGLDHPLYDVWVVACRSSTPREAPSAIASIAAAAVGAPDSADNEAPVVLPENAGQ
jgi:hypothetical protein